MTSKPTLIDLNNITAESFSDLAEKWASYVYGSATDRNSSAPKATQVRKFYDEVVMWHSRTRGMSNDDFQKNLPFIRMLSAKVSYAKARKHVNEGFVEMLTGCVKQVNNAESFNNFKHFFEAFIGYYKLYAN